MQKAVFLGGGTGASTIATTTAILAAPESLRFWVSPPAVLAKGSASQHPKISVQVSALPLKATKQQQQQQQLPLAVETPAATMGRRLVEECLFLNPQYERLPSGQLIGAQCCGCGAVVRNWPVFVSNDVHVRKRKRTPYASRLRFAFGTPAPIGSPAEFAVALYTHSMQRWSAPCSLCGRDRRDHRGRASTRSGARDSKSAKAVTLGNMPFDAAAAMHFNALACDPMLPAVPLADAEHLHQRFNDDLGSALADVAGDSPFQYS